MDKNYIAIFEAHAAQFATTAAIETTLAKSLAQIADLPDVAKESATKKLMELKKKMLLMINKEMEKKLEGLGDDLDG